MEKGIIKEHRFPRNQFFYWVNPGADNDLILFRGMEPNLNWEEYADALLGLADELAVARVYLLGGVLDKTPHTREPGVTCACSSEHLREEMQPYGVQFSEYEGPGSFSTTLLHICRGRGKEAVSLTARASYYPEFNIVISRNPKTIRTLVRRLNHLLCLNLDISDLDTEADELEEKLNLMASQNPNLQAYIEGLEKDFLEVKYEEPLEMSPDEAVRIAEEFLRGNSL
jgi:proteasome assembly chaperone (PAC2) family protein